MELGEKFEVQHLQDMKQYIQLEGTPNSVLECSQAMVSAGDGEEAVKESHFVITVLPPHMHYQEVSPQTPTIPGQAPAPTPKAEKQKKHSDGKKVCNLCGKVFARSAYLVLHMRSHTGEKPYSCTVCGKKFSHQSGLNRHTRIHSGTRPYACKYCSMSFNQSTHRNTHVRAHEEKLAGIKRKSGNSSNASSSTDPILRPYKCDECPKAFPSKVRLKSHIKMHTGEKPFTCVFCEARFSNKGAKHRHERVHTGEKPFTCSYCDKRFVCSTGKKRHERVHTGERPYSCFHCAQTFSSSSTRSAHITNIHTNPIQTRTQPLKAKLRNTVIKKDIKCPDCNRSFALELSLKIHRDLVHNV